MKNTFTAKLLRTLARGIFAGVSLYNIHEDESPETLPIINIKDIVDGQINEANLSYIHATNLKNIKKSMVLPDDVIITSRGTQLKIATVPSSLKQAVITSNLIAIRLGEQMLPDFLTAYLKTTNGQKAILSRATSSTAQLVLTISQVGEIEIPVPPLSLQEKIVSLANAAEEQYLLSIESANLRRMVANQVIIDMLNK